jgi:tetratricopeptide (TPR) repeat protein
MSATKPKTVDYKNKTALIVDDFPNMRSAFRMALAAFGLTKVDMAANAAEAIQRVKNTAYDIIICDYNLGDSRDGQQILEEMRHLGLIGLETAFLMVTAESVYERVVAAAELAPDDYLIKPFNADVMRSRLDGILAKKEAFADIYLHFDHGEMEAALAGCDNLMQNVPKYRIDAMRFKGEILIAMGRPDEARELYDEVIRMRAVPWARLGLAKAQHMRKKEVEAETILVELVEQYPGLVPAYDLLADVQIAQDKYQEAQATLQRGVETSAKSILRQRRLGEVSYRNGDLDAAKTAFDAAIQKGKYSVFHTPNDFANLARVHIDQGQTGEALKVLQDHRKLLQESDEGKLVASVMAGLIHTRSGNKAEAERHMKEALRLRESGTVSKPELLLDLAEGCLKAGLAEDASALIGEVARNAHDNPQLLDKAKAIYHEAGRPDEAHSVITQATEQVVNLSKEGALLSQRGDMVNATKALFRAAREAPRNPRVLMNAAWVAMRLVEQDPGESQYLAQVRVLLDDVALLAPDHPRLGGLQTMLRSVESALGIRNPATRRSKG